MPKSPRPPLDELIAKSPGAMSVADADAHIAARRKALGVDTGMQLSPDVPAIGAPEPLPKPALDYGDPPLRPEPNKKTAASRKLSKPKSGKDKIRLVKSDINPSKDDVE